MDRLKAFEKLTRKIPFKKTPPDTLKKDFILYPASIHHHGNERGGLYIHSFRVYANLEMLTSRMRLTWSRPESPLIVGLFHDLCKLDTYKLEDGSFVHNHLAWPGHGEKSVMMLGEYIDLTDEEKMCIRWHMGAFDKSDNWPDYTNAVKRYPNVLYTHTADMLASQVEGV